MDRGEHDDGTCEATTSRRRSDASAHGTRRPDGGSASLVLSVGLLVLTVALVGCAQDGDSGAAADGDAMTAQEGLDAAETAAEEWSSDATFIGASASETAADSHEDWPAEAPEWQPDAEVGDGRSPQWIYTFEDAEGNLANVYLTADGQTHVADREEGTFFMQDPVEDWSVSSADAVQAAADADEEFASAIEEDGIEIGYLLAQGGGDKLWLINAQSSDGNVQMEVDAETGDAERAN